MLHLPQIQPREPAEYHKLSAGPDRRWYRPLLAIVIALVVFLALSTMVTLLPLAVPALHTPGYEQLFTGEIDATDPVVFTVLMLSIAVLIPAVLAGVALGARTGVGYFFSVEGRLRYKWLAACFAIAIPIFALAFIPMSLLEGTEFKPGPQLAILLLLTLVLVPFQSAAEELTFRAGFLQMFGSWIPNRWVSLLVATLASAPVFALLHGSLDVWILADLAVFSLCAVFLMWYTGGVEAAVAMHASNNMVILTIEAFSNTSDSLISEETTSTPASFLVSTVIMGTVTAALAFAAKKAKVSRVHDPSKTPQPDAVYLAGELSKGRFYPEWQSLYPEWVLAQRGIIPPVPTPAQANTQETHGPDYFQ
ncbi:MULTISPECIES: type II CAAX endopeptidase family protein [Actinomycetaceae]|uniref:type II CAAX endopeptidase family protein n=1 Tax=Actinomycetaceae TaxID=2049 RepID=UPI001D56BD69|nr:MULTISPECIES: type II CAAX endopeptidase family protein [Actinomycetaceae]MBS6101487.1 CPBP family intramembrane metalloprotease [Actinomyces sp.]MDP9834281.1 membrane protease YdiL (CAAX protease family) [Gleimia europaea]MDU7238421.1 type II CAAX endopeptidase family protein [Actinomyces sp.]